MKNRWIRLALWLVTLGILAYLFWSIPFEAVLRALAGAAPWTIPVLVLTVGAVFVADSVATWKTFSWFAAPITLAQALVVRGASYPLAVVNYAVGQGAFAYFLNERYKIGFLRSAATILLIMGINVVALLGVASLGLLISDPMPRDLDAQLRVTRILMVVGWIGLGVFVVLVRVKPAFLARRGLFDVLFSAGLGGYSKALAIRLPHVATLLAFTYLYLLAFGVDVPLKQALIFLPVSFLIAAIPLPGQGFGAAQWIMIAIFHPYAPGDETAQRATVLAASLAGQTLAVACQVLIGLVCLRSQLGRFLRGKRPPDPVSKPE